MCIVNGTVCNARGLHNSEDGVPLYGPGSHQPTFKDWRTWGRVDGREGCYGARHCDLLLFKLYVYCSIYHVLYLSTFQSPCPPSMVFCVYVCVAAGSQLEHRGAVAPARGLPERVLVAGSRSSV